MVDEVDEDKNGTIEFEEFLNMMAMRLSNSDKILKVFKVFDKNDDGYTFRKITFSLKTFFLFRFITCLELSKVMGDLGERLSDEEVEWRIDKISELQPPSCFADTGDDEMGRQGKDQK